MIDYFALALTHGLILLALIRIAGKPELDREPELDVNRKRRRKHREARDANLEANLGANLKTNDEGGAGDA